MNNKLTKFWGKIYQDPFKRYLVISLVILGAVLLLTGQQPAKPTASEGFEVHFFYAPGCSHCEAQESFNIKLAKAYPLLNFIYHDISTSEGSASLSEMLANVGVETEYPQTPVTIFSGLVFSGWGSEET
ncbi:MAG: hypothetical protein OEW82_05850, partial [Dehalococcoidia bacterium]|nr:hypothetical protein [Dehalococcoidia bacterium]